MLNRISKRLKHSFYYTENLICIGGFFSRGNVTVELYMEAKTYDDTESKNIVAEITGSKYPNEVWRPFYVYMQSHHLRIYTFIGCNYWCSH
jgi:uncharacterized protein YaaQ